MQLELKLYVREHEGGFYTLRVIGADDREVFTASLDAARQDLELVVGDQVERTHPSLQARFLPIAVERQEVLELDDVIPVGTADGEERAPLRLSVLVGEGRGFRSLWFPRADLHLWVPKKGGDWTKAAKALITEWLDGLSASEKLALRHDKKEWVETLELEAEPPPLTAFTGDLRHASELPIRPPVEEVDDPDPEDTDPEDTVRSDRSDRSGKKAKKPKRPDTPTLRRLGVDLRALALAGDLARAHGRSAEVRALFDVLTGPGEQVLALVGPRGSGKTAIAWELVHTLVAEDAPKKLRGRPIFFADASRLIAGDGWFGEWQRQVLDVVAECEASEVIWFVGPLLPLLDAGKHVHSEQNVAQLLGPYLAAKRLTVIGESSDADFAKLELREAAFARSFTPFRVTEPSAPKAREILDAVAADLRTSEGVDVRPDGLAAISELSRRYQADGAHFGAALHFLRRTVDRAVVKEEATLDRIAIVRAFSAETGLPEHLLRDDLALDPRDVEGVLRARLVGQDAAVRAMADLVAVIKAGLSDLRKPLGSFLFVGPTGVGKTETAKALAAYLFGGEHHLVRFDMSEYVGWDAVHRFLGDAESEGKLVEAVRKRPFSVVLLDEIEKASPAIFDVLLQVLGEARLTDEAGRSADFKNAVIVMTSNLGAESYKPRAGFDPSSELTAHFRREAERF
ncbi:AAA family ATPase, partial [Myxococcota bacterium]|nr:AAA family ATPase [Myxococcota bacterium]